MNLQTITQAIRRFWPSNLDRRASDNRGAILVFMAITLVLLLGFLALAVDMGYIYASQTKLQATADAAALAAISGASVGPDEMRARAVEYALKNNVYGNGVILEPSDVELGRWDSDTRTFTALSGEDEEFANSVRVTDQ